MAILTLVANILNKRNDSINNMINASFFILIYNPLTLINTGFLLSFAGTIGIILFSKSMKSYIIKYIKLNGMAEILSLNLSAQIMIFPIMLYCFNSFSLIGILANLLIIPVTSLLTFLGIILLFFSLLSSHISKFLSLIIKLITNYILFITGKLSKCTFLNFIFFTPKIWTLVMFYVILFLVYEVLKMRNQNYLVNVCNKRINTLKIKLLKFSCVLLCMFITISTILRSIPKNYIELTAIDVGQGDAFLIVTESGKRILIDGGGSETSDYDVGKNILMPYLLDRGFKKIDYIFVSHAHADHIDGIYTILENFKVGKVFVGQQLKDDEKISELKRLASNRKTRIFQVFEGDKINIEDLEFEILHPSGAFKDDNLNNLSIIMTLKCNGRKILFTGDAEKEIEEQLIKKYNNRLASDILKVGHHGAKTSSSEKFIEAVSPSLSIISVAKENIYGHPNLEVIARLKRIGKVLQTSISGEINIRIYENGKINLITRWSDN